MESHSKSRRTEKQSVERLSQAIFTVNRHAKTALDPKYLYRLKKAALEKMIREKKAQKVGLHFSNNPRNSQQQSDVLVECGSYTFHMPPTKEDFGSLPHLGSLNKLTRNPKTRMSLTSAKTILQQYTGMRQKPDPAEKKGPQPPVFKKLGDSFF